MLSLETFMTGIENLKQNFPDATFTELKFEIWYSELESQLSDEEFEIAIRKAIYKNRFCPTGEELVTLVKASERELVLDCWSRCLDALSRRVSLNDLDDASQYAIAQLGGLTHLGELSIYDINKLKPDFCTHWQAYRKSPKDFRRGAVERLEYQTPKIEEIPTGEPLSPDIKKMLAEAKAKVKETARSRRGGGRSLLGQMKEATQLLEGDKNKSEPITDINSALKNLCSFPDNFLPDTYQQVAKQSQEQFKEGLGDLTVAESGYQINTEKEFAQTQKSNSKATG